MQQWELKDNLLKCRVRILAANLLKAQLLLHLAMFWFWGTLCSCTHQHLADVFCPGLEITIQTFQNSVKKIFCLISLSVKKITMFCLISSPDSWSWYLSIILAIFLLVKIRIFCRKWSITCHLFQAWRRNRKIAVTTRKMKTLPRLPQNKGVLFSDSRLN